MIVCISLVYVFSVCVDLYERRVFDDNYIYEYFDTHCFSSIFVFV